ncbi:protein of unknown function [Burkholderia multivorans]
MSGFGHDGESRSEFTQKVSPFSYFHKTRRDDRLHKRYFFHSGLLFYFLRIFPIRTRCWRSRRLDKRSGRVAGKLSPSRTGATTSRRPCLIDRV